MVEKQKSSQNIIINALHILIRWYIQEHIPYIRVHLYCVDCAQIPKKEPQILQILVIVNKFRSDGISSNNNKSNILEYNCTKMNESIALHTLRSLDPFYVWSYYQNGSKLLGHTVDNHRWDGSKDHAEKDQCGLKQYYSHIIDRQF